MKFEIEYVLLSYEAELIDHSKKIIITDSFSKWWDLLKEDLSKRYDLDNLELNIIYVKVIA